MIAACLLPQARADKSERPSNGEETAPSQFDAQQGSQRLRSPPLFKDALPSTAACEPDHSDIHADCTSLQLIHGKGKTASLPQDFQSQHLQGSCGLGQLRVGTSSPGLPAKAQAPASWAVTPMPRYRQLQEGYSAEQSQQPRSSALDRAALHESSPMPHATPALLYGGGLAGGQSASPHIVPLPQLMSAAKSFGGAPSIVRGSDGAPWRSPSGVETDEQAVLASQTPSQGFVSNVGAMFQGAPGADAGVGVVLHERTIFSACREDDAGAYGESKLGQRSESPREGGTSSDEPTEETVGPFGLRPYSSYQHLEPAVGNCSSGLCV